MNRDWKRSRRYRLDRYPFTNEHKYDVFISLEIEEERAISYTAVSSVQG